MSIVYLYYRNTLCCIIIKRTFFYGNFKSRYKSILLIRHFEIIILSKFNTTWNCKGWFIISSIKLLCISILSTIYIISYYKSNNTSSSFREA